MFDKVLTLAEKAVVITAFSVILIVTFFNVISRYFLHASLSFTTELVVNLTVLMFMVGASLGVRYNSHPGSTFLRERTKGNTQKVVVTVIYSLMIVTYIFLLISGWDMAMRHFASGRVTPSLGIPQGVFSLAIPIGSLLGSIRCLQMLVWFYSNKDVETENVDTMSGEVG